MVGPLSFFREPLSDDYCTVHKSIFSAFCGDYKSSEMLALLEKEDGSIRGKAYRSRVENQQNTQLTWNRTRLLDGDLKLSEFALLFVPFSYITSESSNNDKDCGNKYCTSPRNDSFQNTIKIFFSILFVINFCFFWQLLCELVLTFCGKKRGGGVAGTPRTLPHATASACLQY